MPAMYPDSLDYPGAPEQPKHPARAARSSGVLSQPRQPLQPPTHPAISARALPDGLHDGLSELAACDDPDADDLAPTEPQLPSMPKLERVQPINHLTVATRFSEFMLAQDWTHDEALAAIPIERRMRLFSALAPTYLRVVQVTGRMKL